MNRHRKAHLDELRRQSQERHRQHRLSLSSQLDQARAMEEHHREQLLWWKRRRLWLEEQVPVTDPFEEFIRELD